MTQHDGETGGRVELLDKCHIKVGLDFESKYDINASVITPNT